MSDSSSYRFGFRLSRSEGERPCNLSLLSGRRNHFLCDPRRWASLFPGRLTARLVDLLRIATAIYVADRISPRDRARSDCGWHRSLSLEVEVFDVEFWRRGETSDCLHRCVDFLSGDSWDIGFVKCAHPFDPQTLPFNAKWKPRSDNPIVCLFSGGLDSVAGLVHRIRRRGDQGVIPVLVRHQSGQGCLVARQIDRINFALGASLEALVLPAWMRSPQCWGGEETSQRCRSFLFCSAAAIIAAQVEGEVIEMMEGGIGAINWPLMSGMVGSKATRSSHPTFARRFSSLLQLVVERDLTVGLPHKYLTKAELVSSLREYGLEEIAPETASCVHYPLRDPQAKQCGTCPACIFRRQALLVAGVDESPSSYKYDVFGQASQGAQDDYLRAFLLQVTKLATLDHTSDLPPSLVRHLRATEVITDDQVPSRLIDLYRRYRQEWLLLVNRGLAEGRQWSRMMSPVQVERRMEKQHA
jgi:7-cyano-7-deazaguanine synthase in queuosine biosynthesis